MALAFFLNASPAEAYIDPGVTSLVAQWLFTFVFGSMAAWVIAPWKYIKRLLGLGRPADDSIGEQTARADEGSSRDS
ncbi:MAG TPA: hypothetical protein VII56_11925 [Rhizomicrobium sp.]